MEIEYSTIVQTKRREAKYLWIRRLNPIRGKGVLNHEKLYENNGRELFCEEFGCIQPRK